MEHLLQQVLCFLKHPPNKKMKLHWLTYLLHTLKKDKVFTKMNKKVGFDVDVIISFELS